MNIFKFGPFPFRIFNIGKIKFADDNSSTNPADVYSFIIEKNENKQKEAGVGPFIENIT